MNYYGREANADLTMEKFKDAFGKEALEEDKKRIGQPAQVVISAEGAPLDPESIKRILNPPAPAKPKPGMKLNRKMKRTLLSKHRRGKL